LRAQPAGPGAAAEQSEQVRRLSIVATATDTVIRPDHGASRKHFIFTEEHEALRESMKAWVLKECTPNRHEWEENLWPDSILKRAADLGFIGLCYPEEYGGQGGDYFYSLVRADAMSYSGCGGLNMGFAVHTDMATPPIHLLGTEDQKQRYLVPSIKGELISCLGITEPGAGSDVAGIRTFARKVEDGYVVNGSKTFITNGVRADFVVTAVKTTEEGGHDGISFLILEREMDGFETSNKLEKLGWHASDTGELAFDDVFVPDENLLGEENLGFRLIMANFQWERLLMALGAVASMERVLERVVESEPGGRWRHAVAEMAVKHEAARCLTYHALRLFVEDGNAVREVTEAKLLSQRSAFEVAESAWRVMQGDPEISRAMRDTRLGPIGGGTDEVMKEILGKLLGL
jgi:acyl-CoA dehydrogenase